MNIRALIGLMILPLIASAQTDRLQLIWRSVPTASQYRCQVSLTCCFDTLTVDMVTPDTCIGCSNDTTHVLHVQPFTKYYWRVNAINAAGAGDWSATWHFTTGSGAITAVSVKIISPMNGDSVASSTTIPIEAISSGIFYAPVTSILVNGAKICSTPIAGDVKCNWMVGQQKKRTYILRASITDGSRIIVSEPVTVWSK